MPPKESAWFPGADTTAIPTARRQRPTLWVRSARQRNPLSRRGCCLPYHRRCSMTITLDNSKYVYTAVEVLYLSTTRLGMHCPNPELGFHTGNSKFAVFSHAEACVTELDFYGEAIVSGPGAESTFHVDNLRIARILQPSCRLWVEAREEGQRAQQGKTVDDIGRGTLSLSALVSKPSSPSPSRS